jgi:hypothetical protein
VTATASVGAFGAASISVTPGPLTPATDLETFAAAVEERVRTIYKNLDSIRDQAATEADTRQKADARLGPGGLDVARFSRPMTPCRGEANRSPEVSDQPGSAR